ncbi:hypothetical protein D9757_015512 [Collybiopsis confluens]|uniref:Uncharacterized protein n=1 Tax=Collybiopsis confluens TaxID=2823264 RepID=A0A8H5FDP4_9AGAR|nr:hypothetical protein D9757_015512 [Collybiopsis confluens]
MFSLDHKMIHSKNTPCAEFSHSSYLDDALAEDDDYYRSTASSACSSPFPQSDSDPDDSRSGSSSKNTKATDLGLIIANTPEPQLREMMLRLAGKSASLRDAITRELRLSEPTRTPVAVVGGVQEPEKTWRKPITQNPGDGFVRVNVPKPPLRYQRVSTVDYRSMRGGVSMCVFITLVNLRMRNLVGWIRMASVRIRVFDEVMWCMAMLGYRIWFVWF